MSKGTRFLAAAWLACGVGAHAQAPGKGAFKGRSVVLVSIDTLRADRLGAYGYPRPTSPAIDALARESLLFERCYSHSPKTAESHMSLFTGVLPTVHGVVNWTQDGIARGSRPEGLATLASLLRESGYRTQAYTAGGNVAGALGFEHGFDSYVEAHDTSLELARLALQELARQRRPFFLFAHTYAVHDPYLPPRDTARLFVDPAYAGRIVSDRDRLREAAGADPDWHDLHRAYWARVDARDPRDVRQLSDLYDAGIREMDTQLGPLLEDFRRLLGDSGILVFLSDHGEEFAEHHGFTHNTLFQEVLHVPLLLRLPGVAARRAPAIVSLSDVMPTLLDLLGLRTPDYVQARSLVPVIAGAERRDRPVVSEQRVADQAAIRLGDLKYIRAGREMLFDLAADPGETQNLLPSAKQRVYPVSLALDRYGEVSQALKTRFGAGRAPKLDAETRRQLQALGYLGP